MRCEIELNERLVGFSVSSARPGEQVKVASREFTSSEDGALFVQRLEGIQASLISKVPNAPPPSYIDNFLAVIRQDLGATIVVNVTRQGHGATSRQDHGAR